MGHLSKLCIDNVLGTTVLSCNLFYLICLFFSCLLLLVLVVHSDIHNTYLTPLLSSKHYILCRKKFGVEHVNKVAFI